MKVSGVNLKFVSNKSNTERYWNPIGVFINPPSVSRDGVWYECSLRFVEEGTKLQITDLRTVSEDNRITNHEPGLYKEVSVSWFKRNLIKLRLNEHPLNFKWFRIRKNVYQRRNTIFVFLVSFFLTALFHMGNENSGGEWQRFIAENRWSQDFLILLSVFTFGSVFFPFTIRQELNEDRVREVFKEEIEKHEHQTAQNKKAEARASF